MAIAILNHQVQTGDTPDQPIPHDKSPEQRGMICVAQGICVSNPACASSTVGTGVARQTPCFQTPCYGQPNLSTAPS